MQDSGLNARHWEFAHVQEVQVTGMSLSRFSTSNMADVTLMGQVHQGPFSQNILRLKVAPNLQI